MQIKAIEKALTLITMYYSTLPITQIELITVPFYYQPLNIECRAGGGMTSAKVEQISKEPEFQIGFIHL